jgi:hypothetical protein
VNSDIAGRLPEDVPLADPLTGHRCPDKLRRGGTPFDALLRFRARPP